MEGSRGRSAASSFYSLIDEGGDEGSLRLRLGLECDKWRELKTQASKDQKPVNAAERKDIIRVIPTLTLAWGKRRSPFG
jgi:hypothetical protein